MCVCVERESEEREGGRVEEEKKQITRPIEKKKPIVPSRNKKH